MKSKEQSFWTVYGIVMLVLLGGAGFYCYTTWSDFKKADNSYNRLKKTSEDLMEAPIYPSKDNVEELEGQVEAYAAEVNNLHDALRKFQEPLDTSLQEPAFPPLVKAAVESFTAKTVDSERPVKLPEPFYLGMDAYEQSIPPEGSAGILKFQLGSIDHLLRIIVDNGGDIIHAINRELTPQEQGQPDPETTPGTFVTKYPVTISFRTTHEGFRQFVNLVSNDSEYFYVIRVLRVDNQMKEGPEIYREQTTVYIDKEGNPVASIPEDAEAGEFDVQDATVIFGNERLNVTAVLDLCRFPEQTGQEASEEPSSP